MDPPWLPTFVTRAIFRQISLVFSSSFRRKKVQLRPAQLAIMGAISEE